MVRNNGAAWKACKYRTIWYELCPQYGFDVLRDGCRVKWSIYRNNRKFPGVAY